MLQYGAKLLISNKLIDHLVLCAQAHKLHIVASIFKETGWRKDWASNHVPSLLELIHSHIPLPPPKSVPPPPPAPPSTTNTPTATDNLRAKPLVTSIMPQPTKKTHVKQSCSWCKALGLESLGHDSTSIIFHIDNSPNIYKGLNQTCPGLALKKAPQNENTPPAVNPVAATAPTPTIYLLGHLPMTLAGPSDEMSPHYHLW